MSWYAFPKTVTSLPGEASVAGSTGSTDNRTSICPSWSANALEGTTIVTWLSEVTKTSGREPFGSRGMWNSSTDGGWLFAARSAGGFTHR